MYVATMFKLQWTSAYKHYAVYDSDTSVTLIKGQGHQTWYKLVDHE